MIIKRIKIHNYKTYLSLDLDLSVKADCPHYINRWHERRWQGLQEAKGDAFDINHESKRKIYAKI